MLKALIKTMRPRQWTKKGFIFFALIFDKQLFMLEPFLRTLAGFFQFCLISSAVYLYNDIADVEADRNHPEKKFRPIASGQLPIGDDLRLALVSEFGNREGLDRDHVAASRDGRKIRRLEGDDQVHEFLHPER